MNQLHIRFRESEDNRSAELYCESVRFAELAEKFGTPLYVYSKRQIVENFRGFSSSLASANDPAHPEIGHYVSYAAKANTNIEIMRLLAKEGAGAAVVSGGELLVALAAGFTPDKITFDGTGKSDEEIELGLRAKIHAFNVESLEEIKVINEIATRIGLRANVAIRVNPDVDAKSHPYISTGLRENKFGIELDVAPQAFVFAHEQPSLDVVGLHVHIGSQITTLDPFITAAKSITSFVENLRRDKGITLKHINVGGGQGIEYRNVVRNSALPPDELEVDTPTPPSFTEFVQAVLPILKMTGLSIIMEPGRAIVANSGALLTRVAFTKSNSLKKFVIADAGMTELIRPSLYHAYHQIVPTHLSQGSKTEVVDVVGPICETGDFLAHHRLLPELHRGDLLAVLCTGAYGYTLASNYNLRARAAEILVDGEAFSVIREREDLNEVAGLTAVDLSRLKEFLP